MRAAFKAVATLLVVALLSYPLWAPQWGAGILGEVWALGLSGALVAIAAFFGLVALYCLALQRTMTLIRPDARVASPASVWWMFAIPYNFVEDFFIVRAIAISLAADARLPNGFVRRWETLGLGWCGFQILSLFPGLAGLIGGAIAIPLWAAHWIMTVSAHRTLASQRLTIPVPQNR